MADRIIDANKLWTRLEEIDGKIQELIKEYREFEKWLIQNTETL